MAGIYIHIPFCRQACTYCNFHFSTSVGLKAAVVDSILKEIKISNDFIPAAEPINSIYFGGGTPSLLTEKELASLLDALRLKFSVEPDAEVTLEANPDDINPTILRTWMRYGINRLSLGIQSFNEEELRWMNRAHTAKESLQSIDEVQAAGLGNFSVDLIFGSPLLNNAALENNLQIIFDKKIPHISCYALTVEPRTALHKMIELKKTPAVNSEHQVLQFHILMDAMQHNGYEHYEISNYALPGMRSRHNSSYWQGKPYYGFGPSAHSFDGKNKRRWNIANNALYDASLKKNIIPFEEELLSANQKLNEGIMTAVRTIEGIDTKFIASQFGVEKVSKLLKNVKKYVETNKIIIRDDNIILTNEGKLFADGIAADLFF